MKELKSTVLQIGLSAFMLGLGVSSFFIALLDYFWIFSALSFFIFTLTLIFFDRKVFYICIICFFLGIFRQFIDLTNFNQLSPERFTDRHVVLSGKIVSDPEIRGESQFFVMQADYLVFENWKKKITGKIRISVDKHEKLQFHDALLLSGKITAVSYEDMGSFASFLIKDKIYSQMKFARVLQITPGKELYWRNVFLFKYNLLAVIERLYTFPQSALVAGLLIGARDSLPVTIAEDFRKTGLSHILAVSGFNITIIINFSLILLSSVPKKIRIISAIILIFFFVCVVGFSASVVRAMLMGFFMLVADLFDRRSSVFTSLLFSASIMAIINPRIVAFDLSFQLSFAATLGLVVVIPFIDSRSVNIRRGIIRETIMVTLAAQVFTLPLLVMSFGYFSIVSPLANVFVLPLIPLIMLFSFLSLVFSFFFDFFATFFVIVSTVLIDLDLFFARTFASFRFATVDLSFLHFSVWIFYYIFCLLFFINPRRSKV